MTSDEPHGGLIAAVIHWSLRNRFLVVIVWVLLGGAGYYALRETPVDAIPDLSENQVIVYAEWPGRAPREIEDQVTYPLTVNLQGLGGVRTIRSSSAFGFTMVNVIFREDADRRFIRTRVLERLALASSFLPSGVTPTLGPDATGVGQVLWYTVDGPGYDLGQLRAVQDWFVRYQLASVPGVAEVASIGGFVREYQVDVHPERLRALRLTLSDVHAALVAANGNVGGGVIENNGMEYAIRGIGLVRGIGDIEQAVITVRDRVPIQIREVATVTLGPAFRRGILDDGGREAVGGVVVMRDGESPVAIIDGVKAKLAAIAPGLPHGVTITPFYDRSALIGRATDTLKRALIEEIILVTIVHVIFLLHFRSILVVSLPLPLSILISFLLMRIFGVGANIMSLSGIAIAIGVLVDAGIVVTENVFRALERERLDPADRSGAVAVVGRAARLVGRPVAFSMAIIILAFAPVFALTGREGKLFHPLAFTKTFAMLGATAIAVTLVPVLCTLLIRGHLRPEEENPMMRVAIAAYRILLRWALGHRILVIGGALVLLVGSLFVASTIGREFMPPLDEGDLMYMPITSPAISLTEARRLLAEQDQILERFPEVERVVGKVGRAETATDPAPINMTETIVRLKPRAHWPDPNKSKSALVEEMDRALQMPGVSNIWTQPIINRIEMLSTGIRTLVGVKVFGSDLKTVEASAREIAAALSSVAGVADLYAEQVSGAPYLEIEIDRPAAARFGIRVADVNEIIETALGGSPLTTTIEGRERFPIRLRYPRELRDQVESIRQVLIDPPGGGEPIPLGSVAHLAIVDGPSMISSENGLLRVYVLMNVRGRDLNSFVHEAQHTVSDKVKLPRGVFVEWAGQYEDELRARRTLLIVFPIVLLVIFVLLYITYDSLLEATHVLLAVPFALTGGIIFLKLTGYNFSVAVWVGFIALFGTAVETAVVMVIYLEEAWTERQRAGHSDEASLREAVIEGAVKRLRPKLMTVATVVAGLLPIFWSSRTGTEIMKPLATPVLGGMLSSLLHVLFVTPVIWEWLRRRQLKHKDRTTAH